jgi:hypothetical protein
VRGYEPCTNTLPPDATAIMDMALNGTAAKPVKCDVAVRGMDPYWKHPSEHQPSCVTCGVTPTMEASESIDVKAVKPSKRSDGDFGLMAWETLPLVTLTSATSPQFDEKSKTDSVPSV